MMYLVRETLFFCVCNDVPIHETLFYVYTMMYLFTRFYFHVSTTLFPGVHIDAFIRDIIFSGV